MPITKVPITHKFGIIALSHREDIQNRLLEKNRQKATSPTQHQPLRNPLDLSNDFIRKFNLISDLEEKERLEDEALKLLARAKRRAGLKDGGKGSFVDVPKAWSELSMLAQCRGKVQEECLDTLIISLHQAPLSLSHIPCLFYLAETTLYWLRTDAMNQPFLRIGEIKLLKMGYTTFLCLFYHHMAGHLHTHGDLKDRLATYLSAILDGYEDSEEAYAPYPGSHLCLKFIVSVGKMIVGETLMDATKDVDLTGTEDIPHEIEMNEGSATPVSLRNAGPLSAANQSPREEHTHLASVQSPYCESSIHDLSPTLWHALDVWRCADHLGEGFREALRALSLCGCRLATEHWVDASCAIRIIGEAALGSLPVLRVYQNLARGVLPKPKALVTDTGPETGTQDDPVSPASLDCSKRSIASPDSMEIKFEEMLRVEGLSENGEEEADELDPLKVSKQIQKLSNSSSTSRQKCATGNTSMMAYLDTPLHDRFLSSVSAAGTKPSPGSSSNRTIPDISSCDESQLGSAGCMRQWSQGRHDDSRVDSDLTPGDSSHAEERNIDVTRQPDCSPVLPSGADTVSETAARMIPPDVSLEEAIASDSPINLPKRKSSLKGGMGTTHSQTGARSPSIKSVVIDPVPSTNIYTESSEGTLEGTGVDKSGLSRSSKQVISQYGIRGWPWEVAYIYTEVLAGVCLYGRNANIKKFALIGSRSALDVTRRRRISPEGQEGLTSAGLLDLAEMGQSTEDEDDDWCWRVRYAAISGLVKISRACQKDQTLEGMGNVVWNALMIRHSQEKDGRVLEAFRVGQVDAQLECEMQAILTGHSLSFKLAAGLAATYLPPLGPPVQQVKRKPRPKVELPKPAQTPRKGRPTRPSLRQELQLATSLKEPQVSFYTRTDLDLKRVVEDQFRKELQEQLEEEERQKQKELEEGKSEETERTEDPNDLIS